MPEYTFDTSTGHYVDEDGNEVSDLRLYELTIEAAAVAADALADIALRQQRGELSASAMVDEFMTVLTPQVIGVYALGVGGLERLTADDYERITQYLSEQREYATGFADAIAAGDLSDEYVQTRAGLYASAQRAIFERARAAGFEIELPQYPADGQTLCKANCRCRLEFARGDNAVLVHWRLVSSENCDDCIALSNDWNPLRIEI